MLGLWTVAAWKGWDFGAEKRGFIPQSVRQAPGRLPLVQLLERRQVMDWISSHARPVVDSVVYSIAGHGRAAGCLLVIEKLLPFSMRKEIAEDQNVALGIILGAFIIGLSLIIAAAISSDPVAR